MTVTSYQQSRDPGNKKKVVLKFFQRDIMCIFVESNKINYMLDGTFKKGKGFCGFILIEALYT